MIINARARPPKGADIILVASVATLWHLPRGARPEGLNWPTLCGLSGGVYAYGPWAEEERHACAVCAARAPKGLLEVPQPPRRRPQILDACCGGRMWWWDKAHPLAVYMDKRHAERGSVGEVSGRPEWNPNWSCEPDVLASFTAMPFDDGTFHLVVFDPPHIVREKQPPEGINGLKYGALHPDTEQDDLARGFAECWRVLAPGGTLIFKWAGPLDRVEPHFPADPIVGSRNAPRGSKGLGTRWFVFYKPMAERESVAAQVAA